MSAIGNIREALAALITENVPGLNAVPRLVQVNTPVAVVEFARLDYHDASMMEALYTFSVTILVSANDLEGATTQLDAYVSPNGVPAALEGTGTLGDVTVSNADEYRRYDEEGVAYLGARLTVEVRP